MRKFPHISQLGNNPSNDCGLAAMLAFVQWMGRGLDTTVEQLSRGIALREFDPQDDGTSPANLVAVLKKFGLTGVIGSLTHPYAMLCEYQSLPEANRWKPKGAFKHWIVRTGPDTYNDPYHTAGEGLTAAREVLDNAIIATVGMKERPSEGYAAREPYDRVVHIIPQGATRLQLDAVANAAFSPRQTVTWSVDDACLPIAGLRSRLLIFWDVPPERQQAFRDFVSAYYAAPEIPTAIEFRQSDSSSLPSITLKAIPSDIAPGQESVIAWSAPGASKAALNGAARAASGSQTVRPPASTIYTLAASYPDGRTQARSVAVIVRAAAPQPSANILGVNCIANHHIVRAYADQGCKAFQIMDNVDLCNELAERPGTMVVSRHFVPWRMNGRELAAWASWGGISKKVALELLNEQDQGYNYDTPENLNARLDVELEAARILLDQGYPVVLGGISMGCPEVVGDRGARIMEIIRNRVAPLYNGNPRVYFSMHLYSPKIEHISMRSNLLAAAQMPLVGEMESREVMVGHGSRRHAATIGVLRADARALPSSFSETDWYETRWRFMFWAGGFNPNARDEKGRKKMWGSELGVDDGGVGGMPAHNYSAAQVGAWCEQWRALQAQPIAVDGVTHESPFLGGGIYQSGNNTDWAGYQIDNYIPGIHTQLGWK